MEIARRAAAPYDESKITPFPLEVYPEQLRKLVEQTARVISCPNDYLAAPMLAVAASFIGPERPLEAKKGWQEPPILYVTIVGGVSSRKSPALTAAIEPAQRHDDELAKEHAEDLAEWRSAGDKEKPQPISRQHVTTNATVEALADVLRDNPQGLLLYCDELTSLTGSMNQYKGGRGNDKQFWLSTWASKSITINRKAKEPLRVPKPSMSIVGAIPPDMLGELADKRGREDGFVDRILFAYPEAVRVRWADLEVEPSLGPAYVAACERIRKLPATVLTLTPEAKKAFKIWFNIHNTHINGPAGSWGKLDGYCVRFACIIHHLRWAYGEKVEKDRVDVESIKRAVKLVDYFACGCRRARGMIAAKKAEEVMSRVLGLISKMPENTVRPRDLIESRISKNTKEARELMKRLEKMGMGTISKGFRRDMWKFVGDPKSFSPPS